MSAAFILTLLLLAFLSVEWLKVCIFLTDGAPPPKPREHSIPFFDSFQDSVQLQSQHNLEALIWSCALGCFILRFMTLGTKINRKYRSISVLITEQINLYLQVIITSNIYGAKCIDARLFYRLNKSPTTKTNLWSQTVC